MDTSVDLYLEVSGHAVGVWGCCHWRLTAVSSVERQGMMQKHPIIHRASKNNQAQNASHVKAKTLWVRLGSDGEKEQSPVTLTLPPLFS